MGSARKGDIDSLSIEVLFAEDDNRCVPCRITLSTYRSYVWSENRPDAVNLSASELSRQLLCEAIAEVVYVQLDR